MKLHHVALICSSQENADRFFNGILGLEKIKTSTLQKTLSEQLFNVDREPEIILYGNEAYTVEVFVDSLTSGKNAPFAHLCLEVKDREEFLGRCRKACLDVRRVPKGESQVVFIRDYDGNLFEIKETT